MQEEGRGFWQRARRAMLSGEKTRAGLGDPRTLFQPYLPGSVVGEDSLRRELHIGKVTKVYLTIWLSGQ